MYSEYSIFAVSLADGTCWTVIALDRADAVGWSNALRLSPVVDVDYIGVSDLDEYCDWVDRSI